MIPAGSTFQVPWFNGRYGFLSLWTVKAYLAKTIVDMSSDIENGIFSSIYREGYTWQQSQYDIGVCLKRIITQSDVLSLEVLRSYAQECLDELPSVPREQWNSRVETLGKMFEHQLRAVTFFHIPADRLVRYQHDTPFDSKDGNCAVSTQFPRANTEAIRANKCFAVSQYTACVFHLMRALELALRAINRSVGLPEPLGRERNWQNMLDAIAKSAVTHSDKEFHLSAVTFLHSIRVSWRNPTMHVEADYEEESAEDIFNATGAFMRHIATKLTE